MDSNLFLFKFATVKDKNRVLEGAPWSFGKKLLMFMEYDGNLRILDYKFEKASFWVRIYGLPLKLINEEIATALGRRIGDLVGIDENTSRVGA